MKSRQSGVALITAVLLIAIISVIVLRLATRQQIDLQRTTYLDHTIQSKWYAVSAENWAKTVLSQDDNSVDSLRDDWAVAVPPLKIEEGLVAGRIVDLQSRFNINNLVQRGKPHPPSVLRFERLLQLLSLDPAILAAILDWIDEDQIETAGGAEDSYYITQSPPYRAANRPLADVSELLLIRGISTTDLEQLRPFISILPEPTAININTASETLLMILAEEYQFDHKRLMQKRTRAPLRNVSDLNEMMDNEKKRTPLEGLAVNSNYFALITDVALGVVRSQHHTLMQRQKTTVVSLRRWNEAI